MCRSTVTWVSTDGVNFVSSPPATSSAPLQSVGNLWIGNGFVNGGSGGYFMSGALANIRVWTYPLTQVSVKSLLEWLVNVPFRPS